MTLKYTCPDCSGRRRFSSGHPNDPSSGTIACDTCNGEGEIPEPCDAAGCRAQADETIGGLAFCAAHAAVERENAFWVGEAA